MFINWESLKKIMVIKYDVYEYQGACQIVRNAKRQISSLPEDIQKRVSNIVKRAIKGTYLACKSIYEPTTDPKKCVRIGSDSDFETDKKGLSELENLFD